METSIAAAEMKPSNPKILVDLTLDDSSNRRPPFNSATERRPCVNKSPQKLEYLRNGFSSRQACNFENKLQHKLAQPPSPTTRNLLDNARKRKPTESPFEAHRPSPVSKKTKTESTFFFDATDTKRHNNKPLNGVFAKTSTPRSAGIQSREFASARTKQQASRELSTEHQKHGKSMQNSPVTRHNTRDQTSRSESVSLEDILQRKILDLDTEKRFNVTEGGNRNSKPKILVGECQSRPQMSPHSMRQTLKTKKEPVSVLPSSSNSSSLSPNRFPSDHKYQESPPSTVDSSSKNDHRIPDIDTTKNRALSTLSASGRIQSSKNLPATHAPTLDSIATGRAQPEVLSTGKTYACNGSGGIGNKAGCSSTHHTTSNRGTQINPVTDQNECPQPNYKRPESPSLFIPEGAPQNNETAKMNELSMISQLRAFISDGEKPQSKRSDLKPPLETLKQHARMPDNRGIRSKFDRVSSPQITPAQVRAKHTENLKRILGISQIPGESKRPNPEGLFNGQSQTMKTNNGLNGTADGLWASSAQPNDAHSEKTKSYNINSNGRRKCFLGLVTIDDMSSIRPSPVSLTAVTRPLQDGQNRSVGHLPHRPPPVARPKHVKEIGNTKIGDLYPKPPSVARSKPVKEIGNTKIGDLHPRAPPVARSKPEQPSPISRQPSRPVTGGKSLSLEYWEGRAAAIREMERSPSCDPECDNENTVRERSISPLGPDDKCHFVYDVLRRTWASGQDKEKVPWLRIGNSQSTLRDANYLAGEEFQRERSNVSVAPLPEIHLRTDNDGLQSWLGVSARGGKEVCIVRSIRTLEDGVWPTSKDGWLDRQCFAVVKTETVYEIPEDDDPPDDLFEATSQPLERALEDQECASERRVLHTQKTTLEWAFTIRDMANQRAHKHFVKLRESLRTQNPNDTRRARMDDVLAETREADARLERLAKDDESYSGTVEIELDGRARTGFADTVTTENGGKKQVKEVKIYVEGGSLKGPRNC